MRCGKGQMGKHVPKIEQDELHLIHIRVRCEEQHRHEDQQERKLRKIQHCNIALVLALVAQLVFVHVPSVLTQTAVRTNVALTATREATTKTSVHGQATTHLTAELADRPPMDASKLEQSRNQHRKNRKSAANYQQRTQTPPCKTHHPGSGQIRLPPGQ